MGRKIPGTKHHGVRDPEKQRAVRFKQIKHKINTPPVDPDDQQVPKSLQRLAELQAKTKNGDYSRKKTKSGSRVPTQFQQLPGETDRLFLNRVNRVCNELRHQAVFENKFGVEVNRNEQGEVQNVTKRPKDPLQKMVKEVRDEKNKKKKKKKGSDEPRLSKSQKRSAKLLAKKQKNNANKVDEFDRFKDEVKFGEQAHEPPKLTVPKKFLNHQGAPRPGNKDLLLKSMLPQKGTSNKTIDKKGKRKELPNALRRQLDLQQEEVIKAYRALKGSHHTSN